MNHPPSIQTPFEKLPTDPGERHEFLVDVFGRYIFWALQEAMSKSKELVSSPDARAKLGRIFERPYLQMSELSPEQQEIAFNFTSQAMENTVKNILIILGAQGITFRLGENHAVQFRLTSEIRDIESMDIQLEEIINRGGKKAFMSYWGHWLRQNKSESKTN